MLYTKSYFDLVTEDGHVCVAYDSRLEMFERGIPFAGVEIYEPCGARRVLRARRAALRGTSGFGARELELELDGGVFRIRHEPIHGAFTPSGVAPHPGLGWRVRSARARATAELELGRARRTFTGLGYEDEVRLSTVVRGLELSSVAWGRAHLADETWVYTVVTSRDGREWSRLARFRDGIVHDVAAPRLVRTSSRIVVCGGDEPLELCARRALHEGSAFDERRFPSRIERALARALNGAIVERRTLAHARRGSSAGSALEEFVRLG